MRIVFMGTPDFSVPSLKALYDAHYDIAAVYTQPDRQRGRGKKITYSPVKEAAVEMGIPVYQPYTFHDSSVISQLASLRPDAIIVIAYGKILPKEVLTIPPFGCLNVHGSLLPKYRGAAPIQYAVKDGVPVSGVTIMLLDEGMDTGKILKKAELPLASKETAGSLFDKLAVVGAETLLSVLNNLQFFEASACPQNESEATYTSKITKEMAQLDFTNDADVLECLIRALDPQPGAYTFYKGKRLKIWAADVVPGNTQNPGTVIDVNDSSFTVQTGKNALRIYEVQPESRKRMSSAQFLHGCHLTVGESL